MKLFLSTVIIFLLVSLVSANSDWEKFTKIQRTVMAANGYLTKDMYNEFWSLINNNIKGKAQQEKFITGMKGTLPVSMIMQMESWKSALLSYDNKQIVKTPKLINYMRKINEFKSKNNSQQDANVLALQKSIIKINDLLSKISKRKAIIVDGKATIMDRTMILFTLSNIHNTKRRLNSLYNKKWKKDILVGSDLDNTINYNNSLPKMVDKETKNMLIIPEIINKQLVYTYYYQLLIDSNKLPTITFLKNYQYKKNCKLLQENETIKFVYLKKDFSNFGEIYMSKSICSSIEYLNKQDILGFKKYLDSISDNDYFNLNFSKELLGKKFFKIYNERLLDVDIFNKNSEIYDLNNILK